MDEYSKFRVEHKHLPWALPPYVSQQSNPSLANVIDAKYDQPNIFVESRVVDSILQVQDDYAHVIASI
jgi:hypothetical protein